MKLSSKIYIFIFSTITLTLSLLTLLMHFKYHVTRADLVNTRLSIVTNDMKWSIEKSFKIGIDISKLHNIQNIIETNLKQNKEIEAIRVFKYDNSNIDIVHATSPQNEETYIKQYIRESIFSSRYDYWSFEYDNMIYVGVSFKDAIGSVIGGVYITYSSDIIERAERAEIYWLYLRLLIAIIIIAIISYFISYKTIQPLDNNLLEMNTVLVDYLDNLTVRKNHDVSSITHPELRKLMLQTLASSKKTLNAFENLNKLINEVEKTNHAGKNTFHP